MADWTPPQTEIEEFLAGIWADVLALDAEGDRPAVGIHARFLDLGGDSITATQIVSRIRHSLEIEMSLIEMFDLPTIAEQAELIEKLILISELSL
ncbi:MAG: phosphopantetheine-binding protein [Anaerolineae bacterium]